jgi:uncharacterized protein YjlB
MNPSPPITHKFTDDGRIPNNPTLPLVLYRGGIDLTGSPDPKNLIEKAFAANGWGNLWRNGIYPYPHYHSMIHEAMGIARGRATVRFGGEHGQEIEIVPRRRRHPAGGHRSSTSEADAYAGRHRRLSAERQIQFVPRQQSRAHERTCHDPESAAAGGRSGIRTGRAATHAVAFVIGLQN